MIAYDKIDFNIKYKRNEFRKYVTEETQDVKWITKLEGLSKLDESKNKIINVIENYFYSRGIDNIKYITNNESKSPYVFKTLLHPKKNIVI
jgi:hypothetical protein